MSIYFTSLPRRALVLVATLALAISLSAQSAQRDYNPSDETVEALPKYKEAMDAKPANFTAALAILKALEAKVPADSFDAALIQQYRLQTFLQQGDFAKAIEPLERSLQLSESHTPTYFDERVSRELYFYLVQLYFQESAQTKNTTLAAAYLDKADKAMQHWLKITPQTTADAQLLYSQLLYTRAMLTPDKPDLALLQRALEQIDIGLLLVTRPKDTFYLLKLVCLNQLEHHVESAELLEIMLKQKPDSATYWQQLASIYLAIANKFDETKNPQLAYEYNIRSTLTIERAQANGFMIANKDNYNLLGIYFNIGQFEKASELLTAGLKSGSIDNDLKNWELLALCYQQLQRPMKGIDALKEGAKSFPKSGQLDFLIAQAYTSIEQPEQSLKYVQSAIAKGNLSKPYQAYLSLAYTAYSLQQYDVALEAARKAMEFPEGAKDGKSMADALTSIMKEREAKKNKN